MIHSLGSLANHVRNRLIQAIASKDILMQELLHRKCEDMRETLAGPDPSYIEVLLAERAAVCWLVAYRAELAGVSTEGLTVHAAECRQKALTHAHNRLNSALRTLAQVRRLKLPSLRAQMQINVALGAPQQVVNERGRPSKKGLHDERSK
jgi:hypothetical protein